MCLFCKAYSMRGRLVQALSAVDWEKGSNMQGLANHLSEAEPMEGCKTEHYCNACGILRNDDEADTEQMSTPSCRDISGLRNTINIPKDVKLVHNVSVEEEVTVSHLQSLMSNLRMDSAETCVREDGCTVPNRSKKVPVQYENHPSTSLLPGFENNPGEPVLAQKCFAEYHDYASGFQRIMDKVCEVWPVEPHVSLKSRFLADILMDMSTVAVYWAQSVSSLAGCQTEDVYDPVGSVCSDSSKKEDSTQHTAAAFSVDGERDDINRGLLVSMLLPQIKFLAEQYHRSLGSDLRQALHESKIMEFRGFGPDPAMDWIPYETVQLLSKCTHIGCIQGKLNPLFECMWLPWARRAQFYHHLDVAMVCSQEILHAGLHLKRLANVCLSWAIPTRPVVEYMISMAPHGKIAEIGSGLGYWAALLKSLGADIVAVDDFSESTSHGSLYFPETIPMDGEEFVRQGGAIGRALFFCWPLKGNAQKFSLTTACKPVYQTCFVEGCLKAFRGDTVFFVGERDDGCTFDLAAWMQGSSKNRRTWRLEKEMEIPTWPGVHDIFMCFVKNKDACGPSTGKKKRRAARKAQLLEEAHSFLSERYAKEEDFLKASIAAYPDCNMQ